jgi:hypothetical protein
MRRSNGGGGGCPEDRTSPLLRRLVDEFRTRVNRYRKDYDGFLEAADDLCFGGDEGVDLREALFWYHYFRCKCSLEDRRRNAGVLFRRW